MSAIVDNISEIWSHLQDTETQGAVGLIITIAFALIAAGWAVYTFRASRKKITVPQTSGRGGHGGSATVGGNGVALGGRGGRAGAQGSGNGGRGGNARVDGDGLAVGGDGGDGGLPWRPALGAPSSLERVGIPFGTSEGMVDRYGFYIPGRGGIGGDPDCEVQFEGRAYKLVTLLNLLRLWAPEAVDRADATSPSNPQEFWERAMGIAPEASRRALEHVRICDEDGDRPDPYAIALEFRDGK